MKAIGIILGTVAVSCLALSMSFAQMLPPAHPGYPAKGVSPVTGQSTANDPGQSNGVGGATLEASQAFGGGKAVVNDVSDANNARIIKSMGAGLLPQTDTMNTVTINPAGATSTVIN